MNLPSSSQPLDSCSRSRRTEEVARWRWSLRLWRLRRWELSHQRLLMGASPRKGDTTLMRQHRARPRHHPCKGEREVRPSRRNWSSWRLGRVQPGVQKSHPHALLVLLLRRPPCACESSWCLRARLPPWQDVAAELHAPGILKAVPKVSISYPTSSLVVLKGSSSLDVHPPAQVGQTRFFLLSGRGHCPRGQPRSPSVACQGILSGEGH